MRWRRISEMVSRSMPPELSAPSLNSTTAPMGRLDASASTCFRLSPMCVDVPCGFELVQFLDAFELLAQTVQAHLKSLLQAIESDPEFSTLDGRAPGRRDPPPASLIAMLAESSTTTATIFCCGRSVATLSAGCHSINSSSDANSVCNIQTATGRTPVTRTDPAERRRTSQPRHDRRRDNRQRSGARPASRPAARRSRARTPSADI